MVTDIAVADEIAAAADLVKGKLAGIPVAVGIPGGGSVGTRGIRRVGVVAGRREVHSAVLIVAHLSSGGLRPGALLRPVHETPDTSRWARLRPNGPEPPNWVVRPRGGPARRGNRALTWGDARHAACDGRHRDRP